MSTHSLPWVSNVLFETTLFLLTSSRLSGAPNSPFYSGAVPM
jgi:hypothetical protein